MKLPRCLPSTAGRIFLDGCFLRYGAARRDFSADPFSPDSDTAVCSSSNNSNRTRAASFAGAAAGLLRNVTDAAPGGEGYYSYGAAGAGTGDGEERVYAAAQCWRSLNATACGECVASARERVVRRCLPGALLPPVRRQRQRQRRWSIIVIQ